MKWKTVSDGGRGGSSIGEGRYSGERRTPWWDNVGPVCWDGDGVRPGWQMVPYRGASGGVGVQGRSRNLPQRGV